jgi:hypothetical protein
MSFLDLDSNGYVDFKEFSSRITPNILAANRKHLHIDKNEVTSSLQPDPRKMFTNYAMAKNVLKAHEKLRKQFTGEHSPTPATRYGCRPLQCNTFGNFQPPPTAHAYTNEQDRFKAKNLNPLSFSVEDK